MENLDKEKTLLTLLIKNNIVKHKKHIKNEIRRILNDDIEYNSNSQEVNNSKKEITGRALNILNQEYEEVFSRIVLSDLENKNEDEKEINKEEKTEKFGENEIIDKKAKVLIEMLFKNTVRIHRERIKKEVEENLEGHLFEKNLNYDNRIMYINTQEMIKNQYDQIFDDIIDSAKTVNKKNKDIKTFNKNEGEER